MKTWTFYHEDMIIENRKFIVKNLLIEMKTVSQSVQYWMGLKEQQNKIALYNQKGIKQSGCSGGVWTKWLKACAFKYLKKRKERYEIYIYIHQYFNVS